MNRKYSDMIIAVILEGFPPCFKTSIMKNDTFLKTQLPKLKLSL